VRLASRRSVGIDAALDLGQALVVAKDHLGHGNNSTDHDCGDRDKEDSQAENSIDESIHSPPPASAKISGGADRDRTGGLLVANQALSQLSYSPITRRLSLVDCR
jgi:hypothetical protein